MPQLGFGPRRERQEAEQALSAHRIHQPEHAVEALRQGRVDDSVRDHIITAFGRHPDVVKALDGKSS